MLKTYVEFFYPGVFISETTIQELPSRKSTVELPEGAYGYRLFSRSEVEQDGEVLVGPPKDYSPTTYYGIERTLEQVRNLPGDNTILISNMEINNWDRVVFTQYGQCFPLNPDDIVVSSEDKS